MSKSGVHKVETLPKRRKSVWRILFWIFLLLIIAIAILAFWIWTNRFSLIEDQIKKRLAQDGYETELSLTELAETSASAQNIIIRKDGETLLRADRIDLGFDWREAMKGRFDRIEISKPVATIKIDKDGNIISLPLRSDGSSEDSFDFPENGILLKDGRLQLESPFGSVNANLNADIISGSQAELDIVIEPAKLNYGELGLDIFGDVSLAIGGAHPKADIDVTASSWTYKNMSGKDLILKSSSVDIKIGPEAFMLDGQLAAKSNKFNGSAVNINGTDFLWEGSIGLTRGQDNIVLANGKWDAKADSFSVFRDDKRDELAQTLSLYSSLSRTPVTEDFAAPLMQSLNRLLKNGELRGQGLIDKTEASMSVKLSEPMLWKSANATITVNPDPSKAEYYFEKSLQQTRLTLNARLSGQYPASVQDGELLVGSTNGRNIKGVKHFKGQVTLPSSWRSQTPEGRPAELRPMTSRIEFSGRPGARTLKVDGPLDFDGNIPGGYVQGLKTAGKLNVELGNTTEIFFAPQSGRSDNHRVTMERFESPTPWIASQISFDLLAKPGVPLFRLGHKKGDLTAALENLEMVLDNVEGTRSLKIGFAGADIDARIAEIQSWEILGRDVLMTSDNVPSAGTEMRAPTSRITAVVKPGTSPEFTVDAPSADVKTQQVIASGLTVQVAGIPEKFRVDYQNGDVSFAAADLPAFQMEGFVNYEDDNWTGKADSFLPFGSQTPIDITYGFIDGRGIADVDIPEMLFSPLGLQPQSFIPALQGKIADVDGIASAKVHLEFSDADGMVSSGSAKLVEMNMGTAPGPLRGLNSDLTFSSFFPLVTNGPQKVTIRNWDVGFPLPEGVVEFEAVPDGVKISSAVWPLGTGQVSLDPVTWTYTAPSNRMLLRVKDVSIEEFIGELGGDSFQATGIVTGELPVVISGVDVQVENGHLAVKDGGVVKFATPFTDKAGETNGYAKLAFDALKEFYYEELEVTIDGPLDGLINIRLVFNGFNPNVVDGAYIRYNLNIEGELLNIVRNFQRLGGKITEEIKNAVLEDDER